MYATGDDSKTASINTTAILNRENVEGEYVIIDNQVHYQVTLSATDHGVRPLTTNCFFFVRVNDENDNHPIFDNIASQIDAYMMRITANNARVIQVHATDLDYGENARVTYTMVEDSGCPGCFDLDANTGWLTRTNAVIDAQVSV